MLVLTRKLGETIQIGDEVCITVLKVKGNTVRIGIEAPASVRVKRGELPPRPARTEITLVMPTESEDSVEANGLPATSKPRYASWCATLGGDVLPLEQPAQRDGGRPTPRENVRAGAEMTRLREIVDRVSHTPLKTIARAIGASDLRRMASDPA